MAEFHGLINEDIHLVVPDQEEVPICPRCAFPNRPEARSCEDCGHPLQGGNVRWVKAGLVHRCENPECNAYVCSTDRICTKCGRAQGKTKNTDRPAPGIKEPGQTYVKICTVCHKHNPATADICDACGAELPLLPEELGNAVREACAISLSIENIRTGVNTCLEMPLDSDLAIGTLGLLSNQFEGALYVSREHLHLIRRPDGIFIRDTSTNGTYINGNRLEKGKSYALASGEEIVLGDPSRSEPKAAFIRITY